MKRTVTIEDREYGYTPTRLEDFVETLAGEWGLGISKLIPSYLNGHGPFLERKAIRELDFNIGIWYQIYPSKYTRDKARQSENSDDYMGEVTPLLYEDNEPSSEIVTLIKGGRKVRMHFRPDGMKIVTVQVAEVEKAPDQAQEQVFEYRTRLDAVVERDFNGTAQNPVGDMQNAFDFVRKYLG